jgi:Ribbon-helix-helix protein, copG family
MITHRDETAAQTPPLPRPPGCGVAAGVLVGLIRGRSYWVILPSVKTAISVPDDTFDQAERRAAALGMSRSEFFTRAAQHYIEQLDAQSLTARIDAAIALVGTDDSAQAAVAAGRRLLASDGDEW